MQIFRSVSLSLIFILCALGAATRNAVSLLLLCVIGGVLMALLLASLFREIPGLLHWTAAIAGLFFICSGVGSFSTQSLGVTGFIAIHLLIFATYGTSLFLLFRRISFEEHVDESFMKFDLWVLNLGLMAFAFLCLLDTMQANMQWGGFLIGFRRGLYPLSVLILYLLVARHPQSSPNERTYAIALAAAIVLAVVGGTIRLGTRQPQSTYAAAHMSHHSHYFHTFPLPTELLREPHGLGSICDVCK